MILLTRLNGPEFALNPDLIERAEATPDTVVTLVDGKKYVVAESVSELIELVRHHRASVLAMAHVLEAQQGPFPISPLDDGDASDLSYASGTLSNGEDALRVVRESDRPADRPTVVPLHRRGDA
ncbi:MAG: flagellar FlbD family protein [Actinomycetes bacterium]